MNLYRLLGFGSSGINLTYPEALGWRALPYDNPSNSTDNLVFGLVPCEGQVDDEHRVRTYKWGFCQANIQVDQVSQYSDHDGRITHSATLLHERVGTLELDAVALPLNQDNIFQHLCYAQMFVYADILLEIFKSIVREHCDLTTAEKRNLVMREGLATPVHWFNLQEGTAEVPKYITSEDGFEPDSYTPDFLGRLLACFTHWTYNYHGRKALICGFRGCEGVITDLIIMDDQ
ncbi:uncharacterized protein MELLADRAFT_59212 [Melampsora larici-populina 98AG31]|uniref:Alpha-type protein kinase domain-containing protein n=1 Tax=Melampsora larici-populina (strain 98AG31 / pathotype 3-4-7) TaxID=747676 RepID=F4R5G6_MELLP|nr:uncharacterized protein MELLADRAFT_59212 [Melampsora larici-populina 98AG31]EGG12265.1 hypothetical protein MELLADRAFT_59212 [Melampsora larici-populina 98AG31]